MHAGPVGEAHFVVDPSAPDHIVGAIRLCGANSALCCTPTAPHARIRKAVIS